MALRARVGPHRTDTTLFAGGVEVSGTLGGLVRIHIHMWIMREIADVR
jgi:hypothetical protein